MVLSRELNSKEHPYEFYVLLKKPSISDEEYDSDNLSMSDEEYDPESAFILSRYDSDTIYQQNSSMYSRIIAGNPIQSFRDSRMLPKFTYDQLMQLEEAFLASPYLTYREQINLARKLWINIDNIKLWFRKRRLKGQAKTNSDDICPTNNCDLYLHASPRLPKRRGRRV